MNIKSAANALTRKVGRQALVAKKHSPKVMFALGVVGVGATVVLACKATLKAEEVLDEIQSDLDRIETAKAANIPSYTEREYKKDLVTAYTKGVLKFGKLYGPSLLVGIASIAALTGSHVVLNNRLTGVTAAYAALDKGFRAYRERVVNEFGEEKDREFRHGAVEREIVVETEQGPEVTKIKEAGSTPGYSIYAKVFDKNSRNWDQRPEYNLIFLRAQQNYANDQLKANGHLLLNDVYESLGMPRTKEGCVVGWVLDNPRGGDNYVDFGIWSDKDMDRFLSFMTDRNGAIWIDPNVDGVVYDLI